MINARAETLATKASFPRHIQETPLPDSRRWVL